jgi:hypothetical protein
MLNVVYFPSKTKTKIIFNSTLIIVLGLTGPFMMIFIPIFLYLLLKNEKRLNGQLIIYGLIIFATAGAQIYHMASGSRQSMNFTTIPWVQRFFYDFLVQGFIPSKILQKINNIPIIVTIFVLYSISLYAVYKKDMLPYIFLLFSLMMWIMGVARVGNPDINMTPSGAGARYYFVPYVFFAWSLLLCFKEATPR